MIPAIPCYHCERSSRELCLWEAAGVWGHSAFRALAPPVSQIRGAQHPEILPGVSTGVGTIPAVMVAPSPDLGCGNPLSLLGDVLLCLGSLQGGGDSLGTLMAKGCSGDVAEWMVRPVWGW